MRNEKPIDPKKQAVAKDHVSELFGHIANLIHESRQRVAIAVNAELTMLYWNRQAYQNRNSGQQTSRLWTTNCRYIVETIDRQFWQRMEHKAIAKLFTLCGDFSR